MIDFNLRKAARSAGGAGTSSFRLPMVLMRGAPSWLKRCASALDCARQRSKRCSSAAMTPGCSRQRLNERSDTRPLRRIIGTPRSAHARMRLGHRSDSTNNARLGRQWSRKRPTNRGASSGMNWCTAPAGRRCSASAAEVTVPDVTSTAKSLARMRSMRGMTARISPTLAPCSQISGPGGRGRLA